MSRHWQAILTACVLAHATWVSAAESTTVPPAHPGARADVVSRTAATSRSFGFITEWPYVGDTGPAEGITVDDSGDVFVLTPLRVYRYTRAGTYVSDWGTEGSGSEYFCWASGIATDRSGNVYVLDSCQPCVWKFTSAGVPVAKWGSRGTGPGQFGSYLSAIAADDNGSVYVADEENCRIEQFESSGAYIRQWGRSGTGDGEFLYPTALAADRQGHVYVADGDSPRLQKFTASGVHLATWPIHAQALAVDAGANLYALNGDSDQVVHLDAAGHELDRWGGFGWENGQFIYAADVAVEADGSVLVADGESRRVEEFGIADRWRITATAGPHGRIVPDTSVDVAEGMSESYLAVPDAGYGIGSVLVDGAVAGSSAGYTFSGVAADHTIEANFAPLVGWPTDPLLNLPVTNPGGWPGAPMAVSDGAGGALFSWGDGQLVNGTETFNVRMQRIDALGRLAWPSPGISVYSTTSYIHLKRLVADGSGGAIVLWEDNPDHLNNWDLHLQRVNAAGAVQWAPGGVPVCPDPYMQDDADMVTDGSGGVIVTWPVNVNGASSDLVAQRVDATGRALWGSDGLRYRSSNFVEHPLLAPDGEGGAVVMWGEVQNAYDIYAQRLGGEGAVRWNSRGVPVCVTASNQYLSALVPDSSRGAIGVWEDLRHMPPDSAESAHVELYAQRLDASGLARWTANGVPVCTTPGYQRNAVGVADGSGGIFVGWDDERAGHDVYVQHLDSAGSALWQANGLAPGVPGAQKWVGPLVADGAGGVIAAWTGPGGTADEIVAQRLSAGGTPLWPQEGVVLSAARSGRDNVVITGDGFEGAIAGWLDYRDWYGAVYAQRVDRNGLLGGAAVTAVPATGPRPMLRLESVAPNPHRSGPLTVRFALASAAPARLELLDVAGRRVALREVGSLGDSRHAVELGESARLAPGLYFVRLEQDRAACTARIVVLR